MKRLHWYVLKTFVGPFFMTFFICIFVLLMQFLWKYVDDMVGKGLDFHILAELMFYASFGLLPFAFPLSMLLASIMTFGELGENYELVAMKSSGISLFRIMKPLMLVTVLIAISAFMFANYVLPHTNLQFRTLLWSIRNQRPELVLKEGVFTSEIDGYSIRIGQKDKRTNTLYDILIYDHTSNRTNESVTLADSGYLKFTEDKNYLVMTLYNGSNYVEEQNSPGSRANTYPFRRDNFEKQVVNVRVTNFEFERADENMWASHHAIMNIGQLKFTEDSLLNEYRGRLRNFIMNTRYGTQVDKRLSARAIQNDTLLQRYNDEPYKVFNFDSLINSFQGRGINEAAQTAIYAARSNNQEINSIENNLYGRKKRVNLFMMERHRKFTLSFAVLIFFFIGAPLGAIIRKGGLGMPVVVSILLFILYYIFSMTGEKSAREDVWSMFAGMWFSSYIFFPVGIWLTYKAVTDSPIMSAETYTTFLKRINFSKLFNKITGNENIAANQ